MERRKQILIIRSSNQFIEDKLIVGDLDWKIEQLKNHLSKVYPNNPDPAGQKLVYCGQLLDNSLYLKDILRSDNPNSKIHILHLLTDARLEDSVKDTDKNFTNCRKKLTEEDSLSNERLPFMLSSHQQNQLNERQITWVKQAYRHYLSNYMHLLLSQGFQLSNLPCYFNSIDFIPSYDSSNQNNVANIDLNNSINNLNQEQRIYVNQEEINNLNNDNANNNINNNVVDDVILGNNRDWLDNFYMLSRVIILFSIVYFYSSPLRFLIVTFLGFLIYLYHNGFFRTHPNLLADNNNANIENNNQIPQNDNHLPVEPPLQDQQANRNEFAIRTYQNNHEERPGALSFTWIFFRSFFASLVPDQPNVA